MAKLSKRFKAINDQLDHSQTYSLDKALTMAKDFSKVKFDESVDVSVNLGIDARKSDQMIRGATVLPAGTGKTMRVAVFTQGDNADAATAAGADVVGMDELAQQMKDGDIAFDVVIASPDAMRVVGQLGTLLGPRGLMPNPKVGTVTTDVAKAVTNAKSGQVRYRTDKAGILQCTIGKASFDVDSLKNNLDALLADLLKAKPAAAKGVYFKKITISTTMGPGITVDQASLEK
ncbi:MAG: 50S ribosomal protein L1 [Methylococcales bacterium]